MEDVFSKEENQKNIYVIKHKLADLKRWGSNFEWSIGPFILKISCDAPPKGSKELDLITRHEKVNAYLFEKSGGSEQYINLSSDPRFKNYLPIQYNVIETPTGGRINLSDGNDMPIVHLCELIRYVHRLSNLTAFS